MRNTMLQIRESFWFIPAVLGVLAILLAQGLISLDHTIEERQLHTFGYFFYEVGVSGSRSILGAIGGSMLAVAATSFSITISVLATASSTYGPRLVRNFMSDRGNQVVLGVFSATFLYSLTVLRSIRSQSSDNVAFVPDIAVNVAVILAVICVAVLVYFIHHIADSIQVSTLSARVRSELVSCVDEMYPELPPDNAVVVDRSDPALSGDVVISADTSGFIVTIDEPSILRHTVHHSCTVEITTAGGRHVLVGDELARVRSGEASAELITAVRKCFSLSDARNPHQDIDFAVQQLTEMAVRALSPSTNDPYTAKNALAELAVGLVPLVQRNVIPEGRVDEQGSLRLLVYRTAPTAIVDTVFDAMRTYAVPNPIAVTATIDLARRIGTAARYQRTRDALIRQLTLLDDAYCASGACTVDIEACTADIRTAQGDIESSDSRNNGRTVESET
ncbi:MULTISPECIES: DUF2254 domain-containing protein [Rhodococcus erythropolis group]|nr:MULTISPECIES: DUF2254 domain-containing protein [Rhodococcus erythropolis group]